MDLHQIGNDNLKPHLVGQASLRMLGQVDINTSTSA
jgi:hypothetical protein